MSSLDDIKKRIESREAAKEASLEVPINKETILEIDIRDTELIIRLFNNSAIPGVDLEQSYMTLKKIKEYHSKLLNTTIKV